MHDLEADRRKDGEPSPLFALTRWSIIQRARDESTVALNALFTQYRQPLLTHLRARGCGEDQAEDLVQGFCAHLLGRDFLANVAREKGRFRTWLLNALQNYVRDQFARQNAVKRGEGRVPDSLDQTHEDGAPVLDPAADTASESIVGLGELGERLILFTEQFEKRLCPSRIERLVEAETL